MKISVTCADGPKSKMLAIGGAWTGRALTRRLIKLLSAFWLPPFRNSPWAIPV